MKLDKNSDNQSLADFDDMTFDDMTFDDEITKDNFQESNNNVQVKQKNNVQNKKDKQSKESNKPKTNNKPKANNKPKTNKKKKGVKTHKPEVKKSKPEKKHSGLKAFIFIMLLIAGVVVALVMNRTRNMNKHVTLATGIPSVNEAIKNEEDNTSEEDTVIKEDTDIKESKDMTVFELNKPMNIAVTVNTKIEGDTEYTDHETYLQVEYSEFVSGYDSVKTYLDEYNETSTNRITLPDKETFYASSVDNDLVMYEVTVTVPEDFPTNDAKHGYTGLEPEFELEIKGTEKEDALITKMYEFDIPSVYYIGSDTSDFTIGSTYKLRYMTTMPMDLKSDDYKLYFIYKNNGISERYGLQAIDITNNSDLTN